MTNKGFKANMEEIAKATQDVEAPESNFEKQLKDEGEAPKKRGRKPNPEGKKNPRINLVLSQEQKDFVKIFSQLQAISETEFVQTLIQKSMDDNRELFDEAKKFTANFKGL